MSRDMDPQPEPQSGYAGQKDVRPDDLTGPAPGDGEATAAENRGTRAPTEGSGGVTGSGAGAGGGGSPEDFDSDSVGGGGAGRMPHRDPAPNEGGDGAKHGSR
jgi:hypothetical protein